MSRMNMDVFLDVPAPWSILVPAELLNKKRIKRGEEHNEEQVSIDPPKGISRGDFSPLNQESYGDGNEPEGRPEEEQGNQWRPYHAGHRKWNVS